MSKSPELVRLEKNVLEYTTLVIDPKNNIGLSGYNPSLRKIREAWRNKEITFQELSIVLTALAQRLDGKPESFKSVKHFAKYAWSDLPKSKDNKPVLTKEDKASLIKNLLGEKKKPVRRGPKQPKKVEVNMSALPDSLKSLATKLLK